MWAYRDGVTHRCIGYEVHASDGHIGNVDTATEDLDNSYLVVDTGWWIFGKKRMIPAGVVERLDDEQGVVHVRMTKQQIKDAPDFEDEDAGQGVPEHRDAVARAHSEMFDRVGSYFGPFLW